jgi:hemolysin activation/secretion protein
METAARKIPEPLNIPKILDNKPIQIPLTPPSSPVVPNSNKKIKVKHFIFKGNTIFSNKQLEAAISSFIGREIDFNELSDAAKVLTELYTNQGYINSGAFIPLEENQNIVSDEGIITIQIIEGKLEAINITGSRQLHNYIRERIPKNSVLNSQKLLEALNLLQQDPLIKKISADLQEGSSIGKAVLNIHAEAEQEFKMDTFIDNSRSPASGSFQRGVEITEANLLGLGDELKVGYRNTDSSNAVTTSFSFPFNQNNGTLYFSYINVSSNVIEQPFSSLDILSNSSIYEVKIRQPVIREASYNTSRELALGLTFSHEEGESSILGIRYPISTGADSNGNLTISAIRFFQDWNDRNTREGLFVRSQFSIGINAFDATINNSAPDGEFFSWHGEAEWLRYLSNGGTYLYLKGDLQIADRPLPAPEQFSLGGVNSVRGYRQDRFLTDNGFLFSGELHIPIWQQKKQALQIIPFLDIGTAWNNSYNLTNSAGTLAAIGLGVQYDFNYLTAKIQWGIPLVSVDKNSNLTWQENGIYFYLSYRVF